MEPAYVYNAFVVKIHDGDTFMAQVDLGFRVSIKIWVRLHGVDAPELNTPEGKDALSYVTGLLGGVGGDVVLQSYKDAQSFARWVCDVWLPDGRSLSDELIKSGHGVVMIK
jgi:endonuclease YncB( thermonuclease family)